MNASPNILHRSKIPIKKDLPKEILENIFKYLTQRGLANCLIVCRLWYAILYQPKYYETIELYTQKQVDLFLRFLKEATIDDIPIGYYIKHFYFRIENGLVMTLDTLSALINLCPFIEKVNDLPKIENKNTLTNTIYWKRLKNIPISYSITDERWIQQIKNNKITAIGIDVEHCKQLSLHSIQGRQRRIIYERFPHNGQRSWVECKILRLPLFPSLRELYMDFTQYNDKRHVDAYYELDQYTLQALSESCPSLASLKLRHFNFNYFTPNNNNNDNENNENNENNNDHNIIPFNHLKKLDFDHCFFYDPGCYKYILTKCPKLTSLKLYLWLTPMTRDNTDQFKQAIHQLITRLDSLSTLNIHYMNYCANCYNNKCSTYHSIKSQEFWPHREILSWLVTQPNQLTSFQYPFDLFTIERDNSDLDTFITNLYNSHFMNNEKQIQERQHAYLKKLISLTLQFDHKPSYTLDYIRCLYKSGDGHTYQQKYKNIKNLDLFSNTVECDFYYYKSNIQFQIYDWMNTFNDLKTLAIRRLWIQNQMGKGMITDFYLYQRPFYYSSLKELHIKECFFGFHINDLSQLLLVCPKLIILKLKNILFRANSDIESFTILALRTHFDELYISNIKYENYSHDILGSYRNEGAIEYLTVKQSSSSRSITYDKSMRFKSRSHNPLIIECQSINNLYFS